MASSGLWNPVFASDELPKEFPKRMRRPIAEAPKAVVEEEEVFEESEDAADSEYSSCEDIDEGFTEDDRSPNGNVYQSSADYDLASPTNKKRQSVKVEGGKPAYAKKVTRDLDSDDQLLMKMKNEGYHDKEVRARLIQEGRIRYNERSISTRYARIKRFQEAYETILLDEDLTDWHVGDDAMLKKAYTASEEHYKREMEEVRDRHWQRVANELKTMMPKPRFSKNACRDRYASIIEGTERVPPELDPDQESRQKEIAKIREANTKRRNDRIAREQAEEKRKVQKRQAREKEKVDSHARRLKREAEADTRKAEIVARKKRTQETNINRLRKLKAEMKGKEQAKKERELVKKEKEAELAAKKIEMRNMREAQTERNRLLSDTRRRVKHGAQDIEAKLLQQREKEEYAMLEAMLVKGFCGDNGGLREDDQIQAIDDMDDNEGGITFEPVAENKIFTVMENHLPNDFNPATDPRFALHIDTLKRMCRNRGFPCSGVKAVLVTTLANADAGLPLPALKRKMTLKGLKTTGNQQQWLMRIAADDAKSNGRTANP